MTSLALLLIAAAPAPAEIRIGDLEVFLNDHEVTVNVAALGAIPATFLEGIQSGLPAHVRFTVDLYQFNRLLPDRLLTTRVVERALTYHVVTKEYKVSALKGEARPPYATRDLRDAQRVISQLRGAKLSPASALEAQAVIYVRVRVETALNGENTFLTRMAGHAEQTERRSDYLTIARFQ